MLCHGAWIETHTSPPPAALCGRPVVFVLDAWTDLSFQPLTLLGVWFFCLVAFGPAQTFGDFDLTFCSKPFDPSARATDLSEYHLIKFPFHKASRSEPSISLLVLFFSVESTSETVLVSVCQDSLKHHTVWPCQTQACHIQNKRHPPTTPTPTVVSCIGTQPTQQPCHRSEANGRPQGAGVLLTEGVQRHSGATPVSIIHRTRRVGGILVATITPVLVLVATDNLSHMV